MGERWPVPRFPIKKGAHFKGKDLKRKMGLSEVVVRMPEGLPTSNYGLVKEPIRQPSRGRNQIRTVSERGLSGAVDRLLKARERRGKLSVLDSVTQALDSSLLQLRQAAGNRLGVWDPTMRKLESVQKQRVRMDRSIARLRDLISRQQSPQTIFHNNYINHTTSPFKSLPLKNTFT